MTHGQHVYHRKRYVTVKIKFTKYSRNTLKHEAAKILTAKFPVLPYIMKINFQNIVTID